MLHYPHINDKGTTECDILNGMGGEWAWEGGVRRSALTQSMQFKGDTRRVATADGLTDHQLVFSKSNTARSDTMGHNQNNDAQDCLPSPSRGMGGKKILFEHNRPTQSLTFTTSANKGKCHKRRKQRFWFWEDFECRREILVCPVFYFIFSFIVVDILLKITKALGIETKGTNQAISIFSVGCTLFHLLLQLLSGRRQNVHFFNAVFHCIVLSSFWPWRFCFGSYCCSCWSATPEKKYIN